MAATATTTRSSAGSSKIGKGADVDGVRSRARRVARRRGRGRADGFGSDDEFERETLSDASDSALTDDSATDEDDSDAESEPESVLSHHAHLDTPSTTQSPPPGEVEAAAALEGLGSKAAASPTPTPAFLSSGMDWNDMVAAEGVNGDASVPVIDFADFNGRTRPISPSRSGKSDEAGPSSPTKEDEKEARPPRSHADDARSQNRQSGLSVRQAYQNRLQSDPSFVPRVGEFWGHDDRLMQKDLRSLSGWWRGRWQERGRGGPIGRGYRGRGRGGYVGGTSHSAQDGGPSTEAQGSQSAAPEVETELPPIEKAWTHDGFEQMKVREERRRATEQQRGGKPFTRGSPSGFSRGGFVPRGRGGAFSPRRGAFSPTLSSGRVGAQFTPSHQVARPSKSDRTWFAMKPERIWTKQFEGFLYFDPELKPKPGNSAAYRVSLPGKAAEVIRVNVASVTTANGQQSVASVETQGTAEGSVTVTEHNRVYIVKVPSRVDKGRTVELLPEPQPESLTTVEELTIETPQVATTQSSDTVESGSSATHTLPLVAEEALPSLAASVNSDANSTPGLTRNTSLSEHSVSDIPIIAAQSIDPPFLSKDNAAHVQAHQLPPLQTVFSPPLQPSPTYGSPYNAYNPPLPPGFALNQQGFAYEIATGRPVYLHTTTPPVPIYNPRPIPPPSVFVPGHMHHPSLSSEFMQAPHTPPMSGFVDPATGQPLFVLPRQSSRVEIRAPTDADDGKSKTDRGPSKLRSTTVAETALHQQPLQQPHYPTLSPPGLAQFASAPEYFPGMSRIPSSQSYAASEGAMSASPGNDNRQLAAQPMDPNMMAYPSYPQQYYYPEQYYPTYMEVPQQPGQYDAYADQHQQPIVYY